MKLMVKSRNGVHLTSLILSIILCVGYWSAAWFAWPGAKEMVELSYESRHKKEIFRAKQNVISSNADARLYAFKLTSEKASLGVEIDWSKSGALAKTDVAIWVETKSGSMIETIFLSDGLRYSERLQRGENEKTRGDILPVWRSRYTAICGIDPDGNIDAISGPTKNHKFDLQNNLNEGESFSVFVEINAEGDDQPTVIYAAMIEPDSANPYTLLTLLGTGEGAYKSGAINYDLSKLTTAKKLIDKILIHTNWTK